MSRLYQTIALLCIVSAITPALVKGQEKVPLVKGRLDISITKGTMECDFLVTDMPQVPNYILLVNTGLNIRSMRKADTSYTYAYERVYNDTNAYESFGYYLLNKAGKFIPAAGLRISYTGMFPVIADTMDAAKQDWKGNIAFNGYSVRADGAQTNWYPVLYDIDKDKLYKDVKYDIEINCEDCNVIYVNGSIPVRGTKAHFQSNDPTELMLFAGKFDVHNVSGTYFLNPDLNEVQMKEFGKITNDYKKFYESKLGIPYEKNIVYVQSTPVSKSNAWLFVSYPTIVNVGRDPYGMKCFFDENRKERMRIFIAHELGHYYFGTYKQFNSEIGDMCSEGFAEYLALQAARQFYHDSVYRGKLDEMVANIRKKSFNPQPVCKIANTTDYQNRQLYVYNYTPLLLTAIEREIGMENMWKWMRTILITQPDFTNYSFLQSTLRDVLKDEKKIADLEQKYFRADNSFEAAVAVIAAK